MWQKAIERTSAAWLVLLITFQQLKGYVRKNQVKLWFRAPHFAPQEGVSSPFWTSFFSPFFFFKLLDHVYPPCVHLKCEIRRGKHQLLYGFFFSNYVFLERTSKRQKLSQFSITVFSFVFTLTIAKKILPLHGQQTSLFWKGSSSQPLNSFLTKPKNTFFLKCNFLFIL